jgi:serine/threonine protein kinase
MRTESPASRLVAGRYRLLRQLGAGAMGTVWRARDEFLDADVALKELKLPADLGESERADRVERALREARHTARLRGESTVATILDVIVEHGLPCIVMELVPSQSLMEAVRDDGPLPPKEAARVGLAILAALTAAHENGIMHRDVKPSNVLIGHTGRVVLTDFGIATSGTDSTLTATGLVGTPAYMAPERLNGDPATPEADLFGLGATIYFAVEGRQPFERDSLQAVIAAIMLQPPSPARRAGPLLDVIEGLLEKDPARRLGHEETRERLLAVAFAPEAPATLPDLAPPGSWDDTSDADAPTALATRAAPRTGVDPAPPDGSASASAIPPTRPLAPAEAARAGTPGTGAPDTSPSERGPSASSGDALPPPTGVSATPESGAILIRWDPYPPGPGGGTVAYRIRRIVTNPVTGDRTRSGLGTTQATELSDAGAPPGAPVAHEVVAVLPDGRRSAPAVTSSAAPADPPVAAQAREVSEARAEVVGDGIVLRWRSGPGSARILIERTFDETSSISGAMRRIHVDGESYTDDNVLPGATYRYRIKTVPDGSAAGGPSRGVDVVVTTTARPRPVSDLEAETTGGRTTLRWTRVPGSVVQIFATPADGPPDLAGQAPLGQPDQEVRAADLETVTGGGHGRLVGESRRGRLVDPVGGEVVYTPVSVTDARAVIGTALYHPGYEQVRDLRAEDRGGEIVLTFGMPLGITEARVCWRRDVSPDGPGDPAAHSAKVTNTSLEIKGGWHLPTPVDDPRPYHLAVFPIMRTASGVRVAPVGARISVRVGGPSASTAGSGPSDGASRGSAPPAASPSPASPSPASPSPAAGGADESWFDDWRARPRPAGGTGLGSNPGLAPARPGGPGRPSAPAVHGRHLPGRRGREGGGTAGYPVTLSYQISRSGLLRRTLHVELRADGPLPDLVLVAFPGTVPPVSAHEGHTVARLPMSRPGSPMRHDIPLGDAPLPMAVRLVIEPGTPADNVTIHHPRNDSLIIR